MLSCQVPNPPLRTRLVINIVLIIQGIQFSLVIGVKVFQKGYVKNIFQITFPELRDNIGKRQQCPVFRCVFIYKVHDNFF